ncbi:MAG: alpha/beta hydrolase [Flavobacterium sp.]|jgi:phospholipase/carboxylesterase
MNYLIQKPQTQQEKYPLLLLLHGYGSNEEDLFSFAKELPKNVYIISLQAPHNLMYGAYAWYAINFDADENKFSDITQAKESVELIKNQINHLIKELPIDKDNITLIGFSQGAILSYAFAFSYPELVKNVVALSGYINLEIAHENYLQNNFSQLSIFASHGSVDQVIPIDWARKIPNILKNLNIKNIFKEYPVGHGIAPQNFFDFKKFIEENI